MNEAKVTMRQFTTENGDLYGEVRHIYGYGCPYKIGDKILIHTKQELDEAGRILSAHLESVAIAKANDEDNAFSEALAIAIKNNWIEEVTNDR